MNLKDELSSIMEEHSMSYKEARHLLEANIRKMYESEKITKAEWKAIKKHIKETLK